MDNKATTKRMIGAVVLVLVAALLLAWLLKGKNRDGQQDMAMNQTAETKPILGFPGVGGDEQKPTIIGDDPNAAAQQPGAGIDVAQQTQDAGAAQQAGGANLIPGIDVKLPETVPNTTGFDVRPGSGGEVRDLVDTDGKVKDGTGSMGTGDAKANTSQAAAAGSAATGQQVAPVADTKTSQAASASQQDKPATSTATTEEKKPSPKVVLVNEKPVPRAVSEASAAQAAAKKAAEEKAAAEKAAKAAAEKAAAAKSVALAGGAAATGGAGGFSIQVLASADKARADAAAAPLKADGYNVAVTVANVNGKTVYRVNVTGFADRAAAEAVQAKMKSRYTQNQAIQGSFVTSSK